MTKIISREKPKIAFVGLGAMGIGMAIHLLEDGFPVSGFDVNPMALERLLAMGGTAASNPRECAQDASFFICMVANSTQIEQALFAESTGAIFGLKNDAIVILCSTVSPGFPQEVLSQVHNRFSRPDIQIIDSPVSGGTIRATQGTLTIMSSGPENILKISQPILQSLGEALYSIEGGLGSANKVKLINQHLAGIHIAVAAEIMGLVATMGLNTQQLYQMVLNSPAHSWMFENRVPHMLSNDWSPHSALGIFIKDMRIVTSEGLSRSFPLYVASAAEQLYRFAALSGYEKEDDAGIVRIFIPHNLSLVSAAAQQQSHADDQPKYDLISHMLEIIHGVTAVEALALAIKLDLSIKSLAPIISNAAGTSRSFETVASRMMGKDSTNMRTLVQSRNILAKAMILAQAYNYPLQITATTLQLLQQALVHGLGDEDHTSLLALWSP
ncbi:hypothetical protein N7456_009501 [Penicillium angulare]|uniref:3-hydroxyisobutyrate dehydrogenase n=1 Tax=Penicillium angulare TaxID=116970 RepID=A0A9W9F506_9EURO|nr:hypothetical protein N7456_009501 [Penicillium angulare]